MHYLTTTIAYSIPIMLYTANCLSKLQLILHISPPFNTFFVTFCSFRPLFPYLCITISFFMEKEFASTLLENAVNEFAKLPGIGRKTALRLVLHLLRQEERVAVGFGEAIIKLRREIKYCNSCHNISEQEECPICANPARDHSIICVVENVKDVMSIENTAQHRGVYHVLGGLISPMDGVGPQDIEIDSLVKRVADGGVKEVILALSATMEGDTTNFYIYRKLAPTGVKVSVLARGVSVGNEIEYTDEITLGRSIQNRTLFSDSFNNSL